MSHKEFLPELSSNLDDLKVRDPKTYKQLDREAQILKLRSDIALARSPAFHSERMERLR